MLLASFPTFYFFTFFVSSGKESITVYSCDCCHEALERAQEMIDAADLVNVKQRFHPFLCDFSISGFPRWLACEHCREFILQKKDILLPGYYFSHCLARYLIFSVNYLLVLDQFCLLFQTLKTK